MDEELTCEDAGIAEGVGITVVVRTGSGREVMELGGVTSLTAGWAESRMFDDSSVRRVDEATGGEGAGVTGFGG